MFLKKYAHFLLKIKQFFKILYTSYNTQKKTAVQPFAESPGTGPATSPAYRLGL